MSEESNNFEGRSRRNRSSRRVGDDPEVTYEYDGDRDQTDGPEPRRRSSRRNNSSSRSTRSRREPAALPEPALPAEFQLPFDPWRMFEAMREKWKWLAFGTLTFGALAFVFGLWVITYKLKLDLIRRENSNAFRSEQAAESFLPREMSELTLIRYMMSPEVINRTATNLTPPMSPKAVEKMVKLQPGPTPDVATITVSGKGDMNRMVQVANAFAANAVQFTRELQASESGSVNKFLTNKLALMRGELDEVNKEIGALSRQAGFFDLNREADAYLKELGGIDFKLQSARVELELAEAHIKRLEGEVRKSPANNRLVQAQARLAEARAKGYTDIHPEVEAAMETIKRLQKDPGPDEAPAITSNTKVAVTPAEMELNTFLRSRTEIEAKIREYEKIKSEATPRVQSISENGILLANLKSRQSALQMSYDALSKRQQETQIFVDSALGYYKPFQEVAIDDVRTRARWMKIAALTIAGALLGMITAGGLVMLTEAFDTKIKTATDLQRATDLPVLATLGNLDEMSEKDQEKWAFRTLTLLRGKLRGTPDQGIVCGFISSTNGEGRSTWIQLLVDAAAQQGLKVLTVDTRPEGVEPEVSAVRRGRSEPVVPEVSRNGKNGHGAVELKPEPADTVVAVAEEDEEQKAAAKKRSLAMEKTSDQGWVWSLERRKQWQNAMTQWQREDHMVLLIELPPADKPESVLMAENLPQVVWLCRAGVADAQETTKQVDMLRHAGCNIVGAVFNDEPRTVYNSHVSRWFKRAGAIALLASSLFTQDVFAQAGPVTSLQTSRTNAAGQTNTTLAFSASNPKARAEWQRRLTLGPGDVLDFFVAGRPELTRTNIVVAADGTVSFLHAKKIPAQGLTVDELRAKVDTEVRKFEPVRTMIQPVAYNSKKYYMLGKVNGKGAYTLDRPVTLIEAVARAKGLETGLYQRSTVELADLSRSFLVRNGKKLDLDFYRLFAEGDLTQNVLIEPGDYIYFPSAGVNEIYVLGEVFNPGPLGYAPNATMVAAITDRGGFTEKAYRSKVLVVRGSLQQPETFIVNVGDILYARSSDFRLQPKDIVYVSRRPWAKVEELLDEAAQSFIQGSVTAWSGAHLPAIFRDPIIPK